MYMLFVNQALATNWLGHAHAVRLSAHVVRVIAIQRIQSPIPMYTKLIHLNTFL